MSFWRLPGSCSKSIMHGASRLPKALLSDSSSTFTTLFYGLLGLQMPSMLSLNSGFKSAKYLCFNTKSQVGLNLGGMININSIISMFSSSAKIF